MKLFLILHNSSFDFIFIYIVDVQEEMLARWIIEIGFSDKRTSRKVNVYHLFPDYLLNFNLCGS